MSQAAAATAGPPETYARLSNAVVYYYGALYSSRSAVTIGRRAARMAGRIPPNSPITNA
jgi:hypothetical protein